MTQDRMIELRKGKYTLQQIAKIAGVSIKTVFVKTGGRQGKERKPYKTRYRVNAERDIDIRVMYRKGGLTQVEIAGLFDVTKGRIHQIIKEV